MDESYERIEEDLRMREKPVPRRKVLVKLGKENKRIWCEVPFDHTLGDGLAILTKSTAEEPKSKVGILGGTVGALANTRIAAIQGIGPYTRPGWGIGGSVQEPSVRRVIGLDLEQTTFFRGGKFPLAHDPLLSAAIVTWDGRYICRYTCGHHRPEEFSHDPRLDVARVKDSEALVVWIIQWIAEESPDFISIHNGYNFDIGRMCAHAPSSYHTLFKSINLGKGKVGMDLSLRGSTVIDTYSYVDKLHRSEYASMGLDFLAGAFNLGSKSNQPNLLVDTRTDHDMTDIVKYNIHDSYLHYCIANNSNFITEIISMCSVFKSPIIDICRYISGTMVANMFSSYAVGNGCIPDWSDDKFLDRRIQGALVISPMKGYHRDVSICDVSGMYPSIMIAACMSSENIHHIEFTTREQLHTFADTKSMSPDLNHGALSWDSFGMYTVIDGDVAFLSNRTKGVASQMLQYLVTERKRVGKGTPAGWALKIGANSFYGAFGARTSGLYSFLGASSVTLIGRWILSVMTACANSLGYAVVYGDTDSIFVKPKRLNAPTVSVVLLVIHAVLSFTPLSNIVIEHEKQLSSMVIVDRKLYYGNVSQPFSGTPLVKGLAPARKDRPAIVSNIVSAICSVICRRGPVGARTDLSSMVTSELMRVRYTDIDIAETATEKRKGGVSYLQYVDEQGNDVTVRKDKAQGYKGRASREWILRMVTNNADSILLACGLPSCRRLQEEYVLRESRKKM